MIIIGQNNLDNKGLGQGQFGWLPRAREPVAADLHVQQVQLVPCQQLQDDVENESEIGSKEAIEERDAFDDLVEAIKKGNVEDKMLDKILEGFETSDSAKKVEELDDEMLDEILQGFETTSDNVRKTEAGNRLKRGKVGNKKPVRKRVARGRGK